MFSVWNFSVLFHTLSQCGSERYKWTLILLANFSLPICLQPWNQYLHWPKASSTVSWPLEPERRMTAWGNSSASFGWSAWQPVPPTRIYTAPSPETSSGGVTGLLLEAPARALLPGSRVIHEGLDHGLVLGTVRVRDRSTMPWRSLLSKFQGWLVSMAPLFYPKALSLICAINDLFNSRDQREMIREWIAS